MHPTPSVILVHEPQPHWAPLLKWEFFDSGEYEVRSAPHLIDLKEKMLQQEVVGCVLVLGTSHQQELLDLITRESHRRQMFVLADRLIPDVEWAFREAGAASVLDLSIPVSQYVRILRKRLQFS